jgi:meiotic recombination protein SPO11
LQFLRQVIDHRSFSGPVFGLFDFDPYGIEILRCYRIGSKVSQGDPKFSIPEMQWLGIKADQVVHLVEGGIKLGERDREKATNMLKAMNLDGGQVVAGLQDCRAELQRMLYTQRKAEIQTVEKDIDLIFWLKEEMREGTPVYDELDMLV